jgi:hypothetical protein
LSEIEQIYHGEIGHPFNKWGQVTKKWIY